MAYLKNHLPLIHGKVLSNIEKAQVRQKRTYDKKKTVKYDYKAGDLVLRRNLAKQGFPKTRWDGPYVVVDKTNMEGTAFRIRKPEDSPINTTTANIKHMRPYHSEDTRKSLLKGGMM